MARTIQVYPNGTGLSSQLSYHHRTDLNLATEYTEVKDKSLHIFRVFRGALFEPLNSKQTSCQPANQLQRFAPPEARSPLLHQDFFRLLQIFQEHRPQSLTQP